MKWAKNHLNIEMKWIKNWLKASEDSLTHYHSITTYDAYENIMGKGEISNLTTLNLSSANAFTLVWAQILSFGKGWLVVLEFNATLTAKVISWRSVTHMCFLAFSHQY